MKREVVLQPAAYSHVPPSTAACCQDKSKSSAVIDADWPAFFMFLPWIAAGFCMLLFYIGQIKHAGGFGDNPEKLVIALAVLAWCAYLIFLARAALLNTPLWRSSGATNLIASWGIAAPSLLWAVGKDLDMSRGAPWEEAVIVSCVNVYLGLLPMRSIILQHLLFLSIQTANHLLSPVPASVAECFSTVVANFLVGVPTCCLMLLARHRQVSTPASVAAATAAEAAAAEKSSHVQGHAITLLPFFEAVEQQLLSAVPQKSAESALILLCVLYVSAQFVIKNINLLKAGSVNVSPTLDMLTIFLALFLGSTNMLQESMKLLKNVLPERIIQRLQSGQKLVADSHPHVVILFSDIVGYTDLASKLPTSEVFLMLSHMFEAFDQLTDRFEVYKVETIGDAYMVAAGHDEDENKASEGPPVERVLKMACAMVDVVQNITAPNGEHLRIRIGIHCGPAFSGVIGSKGPRYCFLGDTVNTASRMESMSFPMCIHVSAAIHEAWPEGHKQLVHLCPREVKGKGLMTTFLLKYGQWEEGKQAIETEQEAKVKRLTAAETKQRETQEAEERGIRERGSRSADLSREREAEERRVRKEHWREERCFRGKDRCIRERGIRGREIPLGGAPPLIYECSCQI